MAESIEQLVESTIESYYEYVVKIEGGCTIIADYFKGDNITAGLQGIVNLSEGLSWLIEAENLLAGQSLKIDSPIATVVPLFEKINAAIEATDYQTVVALIEDKLKPLFKAASSWKFEQVIN